MNALQNATDTISGHSATVEMWLHINGMSLPVVQSGYESLKLRDDVKVPVGPGSLEVVVDGKARQSEIIILSGNNSRWIPISRPGAK
jgi:hypothetical protein